MELLEKRLKKLNSIIYFRFTQLIFRTINELLASLLLSNDNGSLPDSAVFFAREE